MRDPGDRVSTHVALGVLGFVLAWPGVFLLAVVSWPWAPLLGILMALAIATRRRARGFGLGLAIGIAVAMLVLVVAVNAVFSDLD